MASISFRTKGKNKPDASIYIRFRNGRNCNLEIKSLITVGNSDWIKGGKTRNIEKFTDQLKVQGDLDELRAAVSKGLNNTSTYSKEWLQGIVNAHHGIAVEVEPEPEPEPEPAPTLAEMVDSYIDNILRGTEGNPCTQNTVKSYKATRSRIKSFDTFTGHVHRVTDIGINYRTEFTKWSRNVQNYAPATFKKSLKQIKTIITYCREIGMEIDAKFLQQTTRRKGGVKGKEERKEPLHINRDEIKRLMNYTGPDYLENARDWLVVSCWTGCRVSDLMPLTAANIEITIQGDRAIRYKQQKTQKEVVAPFHPDLETITARHSGGFPRPISDQRYNDYIKELCKQVGMNEITEGEKKEMVMIDGKKVPRKIKGNFPKCELVCSHIGRRSFATNHYGKLPTEIIMLVTGHATINQFLAYVGKTSEDHISAFNKLYRDKDWKAAAAV